MKLIEVSATEARNRFFELIELVAYKGFPVVVKKNKREMVRIIPEAKPKTSFVSVNDLVKQTFGLCSGGSWPYEEGLIAKEEKKTNLNWEE